MWYDKAYHKKERTKMVVNIPRKLVKITKRGNVSITIATPTNEYHSAYLTPEKAEALAFAILEAAETAKKGAN